MSDKLLVQVSELLRCVFCTRFVFKLMTRSVQVVEKKKKSYRLTVHTWRGILELPNRVGKTKARCLRHTGN